MFTFIYPSNFASIFVVVQGQASDILIQAKEIERLRDLLVSLYVKHCGQDTDTVGESTQHC